MRTRLWILVWVLCILFPMAFLGSLWPAFGRLFNAVFAPTWMHVLMHSFLYAVLGILLTLLLRPVTIKSYGLLFGLVLLVGICHETIQLVAAWTWPGWGEELFDLGVDLTGGGLGAGLGAAILAITNARSSKPRKSPVPSSSPHP